MFYTKETKEKKRYISRCFSSQ